MREREKDEDKRIGILPKRTLERRVVLKRREKKKTTMIVTGTAREERKR